MEVAMRAWTKQDVGATPAEDTEDESLVQGLFSSAGIGQKRNQEEWGEDWNSAGDVNENVLFLN